ncbi:MAG TPA: HAMP domain-containing sensor histidine kinase [Actinomycetota bacterium]|nr:HAMP domain-containing sensor histidine kinase [Actinomycetota bacterium]
MASDQGFAEMISKIAHELRSPLTSVKGFSATLVKRWDSFTDEQRKQFVETIHQDSLRMARVIAEVVDLARIESGRLELNPAEAHLHSLCERAVKNVAALAGSERVVIAVNTDLYVWGDFERLEHVVSNLIENAVKFSDEGIISVSAEARPDHTVEMRVTDQGVGIDPERLESVFDGPGERAGRAMPSGTGLGLYLSKRLVEAHDGTISAASEEGAGSTFTVVLPAVKGAA